jgi:hypothetical protein
MLVFGGDVWDQGGSLYVIRQLLDFTTTLSGPRAFRNGNRDVNKMRGARIGNASAAATSNVITIVTVIL